jgi:hypothetical protein
MTNVIPAEREAREPGPISPQECWEGWVPALASLGRDDSRDDGRRNCAKISIEDALPRQNGKADAKP